MHAICRFAGYKLKKEDATTEKSAILSEILAKTRLNNASREQSVAKSTTTSTTTTTTTEKTKSIEDLFVKSAGAVDISALLPPGYKPPGNHLSQFMHILFILCEISSFFYVASKLLLLLFFFFKKERVKIF